MDEELIQGSPDETLRGQMYRVPTESLQELGNEVVPDELIRDLFKAQWVETEAVKKPDISVQDDKINADLKRSDYVIISIENYQEQYTGHSHEFVDVEVTVTIDIRSMVSRQRMWNIMAECRRIIYRFKLGLAPYHSVYYDGFQPDYLGSKNYSGIMRIRLTAGALPEYSRRTTGMGSPSTDPEDFPEGT